MAKFYADGDTSEHKGGRGTENGGNDYHLYSFQKCSKNK